jgi:hypothetical protein
MSVINKPVIDNNAAVGVDKPGLHALLIGLSDYKYLSNDNKPFGFKKVQGPAASALTLAHWLDQADAAGILGLRLKTMRLLWMPSSAEKAPNSSLAVAASSLADAESARVTIEAWRDDCNSHQENVALFYFAGHGINAATDDVYLAMGDVGHPGDSADSIRRCIRVQSIFMAMAPSTRQMNMALKQFYFIDACRTFSNVEDPTADTKIGGNKLGRNDADAKRAAPIYFGANSGEPAFSDDATGTRFGKALLSVLNNSSADGRLDDAGAIVYPINTDSLRVAINNAMNKGELPPKGHVKNAELVVRKTAPEIDVSILVRPDDKAPNVCVEIFNVDQSCVIRTIKPVQPNAYVFKAGVGRHRLEAYWMKPLAPIGPLPPKTFVGPIESWTIIARTAGAQS